MERAGEQGADQNVQDMQDMGVPSAPGVFLIDDSEAVRAWLPRWLRSRPEVRFLGDAGSIAEARPLVAALQPDVLLLDYKIPGESAAAYTRELRALGPRPGVLIHSGSFDKRHIQDVLVAGAFGYVGKDAEPEEVLRAIQKVAGGAVVFSESVRKVLTERE